MTHLREAHAAADRIIATDEGWPGAAEDISADDAAIVAHAFKCQANRATAPNLWRTAALALAWLLLASIVFAYVVSLPAPTPGVMP